MFAVCPLASQREQLQEIYSRSDIDKNRSDSRPISCSVAPALDILPAGRVKLLSGGSVTAHGNQWLAAKVQRCLRQKLLVCARHFKTVREELFGDKSAFTYKFICIG